jgi:hypothetical protein
MSLDRKIVDKQSPDSPKGAEPMIKLAGKRPRSTIGVLKERNPWQALSKDKF